jgi:hypothetical protein
MTQTVIMFAAAFNLIVIASFVNANRAWLVLFGQVTPIALALGLGIFGFARIMGWPI